MMLHVHNNPKNDMYLDLWQLRTALQQPVLSGRQEALRNRHRERDQCLPTSILLCLIHVAEEFSHGQGVDAMFAEK